MIEDVERALPLLRNACPDAPRVALVLGSGLGSLADDVQDARSLSYEAVPGMGRATVAGHPGRFVAGMLEGVPVVAMQGRLHLYEGYSAAQVVLGVRLMIRLGADVLIVTNAAGGLLPGLSNGALLVMTDHINLTGHNCLVGPNHAALGPRFPDMSRAYDEGLRALAQAEAHALGVTMAEGVYAGVLGPSYETPAEVEMLRRLGASAVGMSTVQEVIAARHMGARVLGISCVTNLAAGLGQGELSHAEVQATAQAASQQLCDLVRRVVRRLREAP